MRPVLMIFFWSGLPLTMVGGGGVIIIHSYVIIQKNILSAIIMAVQLSFMNWNILYSLARSS